MIIISVDFDGTLALGNKSHISLAEPNYFLINQLNKLKENFNVYIKIVTARGSKNNLSIEEKKNRYLTLIQDFCYKYNIPYNEISFNKEYAHLYIDDMTINPNELFFGYNSTFTNNNIVFTDNTVIKNCKTSLLEKEWYTIAQHFLKVPEVLFCNDELIITKKIQETIEPNSQDIINLLSIFKNYYIKNYDFQTYINNLIVPKFSSTKTEHILKNLPNHNGTFFHGDFSISNILKTKTNDIYLIDPNYKYVFGSYITDAGKAFFSFVAYSNNFDNAKDISDTFGDIVLYFAVAEGCRVCKYKPEYISIVNNIADLIL